MLNKLKSIKDNFIQELSKEQILSDELEALKSSYKELERKYNVKSSQRTEIERLLQKHRELHQMAENRSNELKTAIEVQKEGYEKKLHKLQKTNNNFSNQNKRLMNKISKLRAN
jgi:maltodextrin utilization protein YvdJ